MVVSPDRNQKPKQNIRTNKERERRRGEERRKMMDSPLSEAVYKHEKAFSKDYKKMPKYVLSWLVDNGMDMSFELFKELIDSGKADPYTRAPHGGTCLITLAMGSGESQVDCHKALVYVLDHYPTLVNDRSTVTTETPLHMAAMFGRKDSFLALLKRGADPTLNTYKDDLVQMIQRTNYTQGELQREMVQLAKQAIIDWKTKCHLPGCDVRKTEGNVLQKCGRCRVALYCGLGQKSFMFVYKGTFVLMLSASFSNRERASSRTLEDSSQASVQNVHRTRSRS